MFVQQILWFMEPSFALITYTWFWITSVCKLSSGHFSIQNHNIVLLPSCLKIALLSVHTFTIKFCRENYSVRLFLIISQSETAIQNNKAKTTYLRNTISKYSKKNDVCSQKNSVMKCKMLDHKSCWRPDAHKRKMNEHMSTTAAVGKSSTKECFASLLPPQQWLTTRRPRLLCDFQFMLCWG